MPMDPLVEDVVRSYLALADAEADGLVEGLYLEGSVALGDFRPHTSDIDFVAVTAAPPDAAALAALERAHVRLRKYRRRPFFDGVYLTHKDRLGCVDAPMTQERAGYSRSERARQASSSSWPDADSVQAM